MGSYTLKYTKINITATVVQSKATSIFPSADVNARQTSAALLPSTRNLATPPAGVSVSTSPLLDATPLLNILTTLLAHACASQGTAIKASNSIPRHVSADAKPRLAKEVNHGASVYANVYD